MNVEMIVVGVDGSANPRSALQAAVEIVAEDGVVHVVTAYHMPSPREMDGVWASVPRESRESRCGFAKQD
ncbi:MAG: universal stress protein [Acidobacteria bacterium]|nr:universal stress protein [Acidobacteriota bacterium]